MLQDVVNFTLILILNRKNVTRFELIDLCLNVMDFKHTCINMWMFFAYSTFEKWLIALNPLTPTVTLSTDSEHFFSKYLKRRYYFS